MSSQDGELSWLTRPLVCDGRVILGPLDPAQLTDADLRDISFRMMVILDTIEFPICEGRHLPVELFDRMDTLESAALHGHGGAPRLADWVDLIREFGEHYRLDGRGPIVVDERAVRERWPRYFDSPG